MTNKRGFWSDEDTAELDALEAEYIARGVPQNQAIHQAERELLVRQERREQGRELAND